MLRSIPVAVILFLVVPPVTAQFNDPASAYAGRCHRCQSTPKRCNQCQPAPVMPVIPVVPQPCAQPCTQCQTQPSFTMQPVTQTQIRREAQLVNVPITTQRNVVIDEGGYQTVWVPRLVTKQVPQTTIQQHVQYRDVPYQVTKQIAVPQTQVVAVPSTHYGVASVPMGHSHAYVPSYTTAAIPYEMHTHTHHGHAFGTAPNLNPTPAYASNPNGVNSIPYQQSVQEWSKVPSRDNGQQPARTATPQPNGNSPSTSRVTPAPSAVTAWQAQSTFLRR